MKNYFATAAVLCILMICPQTLLAGNIDDGFYLIRSKRAPTKVLDLSGATWGEVDAQGWDESGSNSQVFTVKEIEPNKYTITSIWSGYALRAIDKGRPARFKPVFAADKNYFLWTFTSTGIQGYYYINNVVYTDVRLDLDDATQRIVQLYWNNDADNQKWSLEPVCVKALLGI